MPQDAGLSWGSLQFAGEVDPDLPYQIHAVADGTNMGNPQPLLEIVKSLLTDGSLAVLQGWDNREIPIRLRLSAGDSLAGPALAAAESALMSEVMAASKSPLVWIPPALDAATCVFDVVAAKLERDNSDGWDDEENRREYRYYLLTLTCLPFARTEESVVVPALPPAPGSATVTSIDACTSFTGWAATYFNLTSTSSGTSGGYVYGQGTATGPTDQYSGIHLTRTGAVSMAGLPYLQVDFLSSGAGSPNTFVAVRFDGGSIVGYSSSYDLGGGIWRCFFLAPSSFNTLEIFQSWTVNTGAYSLRVYDVSATDSMVPAGSTSRELSRTADVAGSTPTQAAIRLYDATPAALGADVLVYTSKSANAPSLRPWRVTSDSVTTDSAMVSGHRNVLTTPMVFRIPAANFTDGTYALMARLNVTVTGPLSWSARTVTSAGAGTLGSSVTASGSVDLAITGGYRVVTLGSLHLPVVAVEDDQMVELTLAGTADMSIDQGWLFNLDDGALTWIRDPDTYLRWVEIRSPELGAARPSVFGGLNTWSEYSMCVDFMCESFGAHRFDPGQMQVFTVTTSSLVSQSELEFYPRYHSHVEGS